ncbi:MAG: hypothetical protein FWF15_11705 [Oscillospiraceae bacterium]|nr:hypothetical protein [Oscillospiraceae bacterium]
MKRIVSAILTLILILALIISCSESAVSSTINDESSEENDSTIVESQAETGRAQTKDNLPNNLNFDGAVIRIIHRDDGSNLMIEIFAAEDTGDIVDTAIYNRNLALEERLNVKIESIPFECNIHDGTPVNNAIRKSVLAGSDDYDVMANHMYHVNPLVLDNMFKNLLKLAYLDFSQPWWAQDFMEQVTLFDKCYLMAGEIGLTMIQSMYLIFYNQNLYGNYFNDDMYDVVLNDAWTLDKLIGFGKTVYTDVNGDGLYDADDIYAYSTTSIRLIDALLVGSDIKITDRDHNNIPYFVVESNERTFTFVEKVNALISDKEITWRVAESAQGEDDMLKKFSEGTLLFMPFTPIGAEKLRSMEDNFGVIPMPKLDEVQNYYATSVHNGFSAFAIIQTTKIEDAAAAFAEAMCAETYRSVTLPYYEVALKVKYSRDDKTSQMLDLIRDSIKFDFAYINEASLNLASAQFREIVKAKPENVASTLARNMVTCEKKLEEFLDKFAELE